MFLWIKKRIHKTKEELQLSFKAQALEIMEKMQKNFFELADQLFTTYRRGSQGSLESHQKSIESLIKPLYEAVGKLEKQSQELEKKRESAYVLIEKQIENLIASEKALRLETLQLSKAFRSPSVRGNWGQLHLRRVVELAGMQKYCDFFEQESRYLGEQKIRPDVVVRLPENRQIIIDAKTPLYAYLEAIESEDEEKKQKRLKDHALHIRQHIKELSAKEYWKQFHPTPECVVLFLPSEAFFSEAVQTDPHLIELGFANNIIVATPTTLIAVLKAASLAWKQQAFSENAQKMTELGKQLYERLTVMIQHFDKLGKCLGASVESYNQAITSLETRVMVSVRKLQEQTYHSKPLSELSPIDKSIRSQRDCSLKNKD